jgi:hypothetical protein
MSALESEQPEAASLARGYRDAYRALRAIVDELTAHCLPAEPLTLDQLLDEFERVADAARTVYICELGPRIGWEEPCLGERATWQLRTYCIDRDSGQHGDQRDRFITGELGDGFEGSGLDLAARAYRRECGWDRPPGDGGIWLVGLHPTCWVGADGDQERSARGNLVGFLIVHDRDEDGQYESVAHIWTATRWRRRGIASHLLGQARARFPIAQIEGPATEAGAALVGACAPGLRR